MSQSRWQYNTESEKRLPFRVRRCFDALEFPAKLEQYLLAEAAGVVESIIRDEEAEGSPIIYGDNYWYFPDKTLDVARPLLVAHVDTVCSPFPPSELTRRGGHIRNPDGILGADDRAGVYAALELRHRTGIGVLLCDEEERGAHGARAAARELGPLIKTHPYMVELDRRGYREVVYYRQECLAFSDHIESYGFNEENGSFSDISVLSRELDIPGANVSVGFNLQHSKFEYLDLFSLWDTIARVQRMIEENKSVVITPSIPNFRPYNVYQQGEYPRERWWDREEVLDDDEKNKVIDVEEIDVADIAGPELPGDMTPEEHDHMVALSLEAKDAECRSFIEEREALWEEDILAHQQELFDNDAKIHTA